MNLVMQLRKVWNHPELLKAKETQSPFYFSGAIDYQRESIPVTLTGVNATIPVIYKELFSANWNPIKFCIPKIIFDEWYYLWTQEAKMISNYGKYSISTQNTQRFFNIYSSERINSVTFSKEKIDLFNWVQWRSFVKNTYSVLLLYGLSSKNIEFLFRADPIISTIWILHFISKKYELNKYKYLNSEDQNLYEVKYESMLSKDIDLWIYNPRISILQSFTSKRITEIKPIQAEEENKMMEVDNEADKKLNIFKTSQLEIIDPLVLPDLLSWKQVITKLSWKLEFYLSKVSSWPVDIIWSSSTFQNRYKLILSNFVGKQLITGGNITKPSLASHPGKLSSWYSSLLPIDLKNIIVNKYDSESYGGSIELMHSGSNGYSSIQVPDFKRLINDWGKMGILDKLLKRLYIEKHRCLIFCQMTKMMNIIEEYLSWKQYTYFRMDGSTQINDRRDMVDEFQRNDNIFCFLLSTRAGGLGVTLTGADTVIFYDNDWNPTMDAQATDRAHRIGQTKEVSVYRLITKHTVEENILKRAKQKESVQSTVYSGGALRADTLKPSELVGFLVDEDQYEPNEPSSFIKTKKRGKKGVIKGDDEDEELKEEESPTLKKNNISDSHKIQYHHLNKGERSLSISQEAEAKAKEILKNMKIQDLDDEAEDDVIEVNEKLKELFEVDQDEEVVQFIEDKDDQIQIDKEE